MRRALAILKYIPAVLCGLLVVAWAVSLFALVGVIWPYQENVLGPSVFSMDVTRGCLRISTQPVDYSPRRPSFLWLPYAQDNSQPINARAWLANGRYGGIEFDPQGVNGAYRSLRFPVLLILTLGLPLSLLCLNRFRFPLWSYFAWTALIAAELAYYLR